MNSKLMTIIAREYLERVKRKSFIISTILMPIFMVLLMVLPALIAVFSTPETKEIAVIDQSGVIASTLQNSDEARYILKPSATLDDMLADDDYYGVLLIGSDIVENPSAVTLYTHAAPSMQIEHDLSRQIKDAIERIRLRGYDIDNLSEILAAVNADVRLQTFRVDSDETSETSSSLSYAIGIIMSFMLYMFILLYGQMVMTSIIEEKNNRVLEIVVSSVRPTYLMLGKIVGIGLVAVTQILIWVVLVMSFAYWAMPALVSSLGQSADTEFMTALGVLGDKSYILSLAGYLLLFLIGGYLFYSSIYAAIGSAVDNIQDASQLQTVAILPIIIGMVLAPTVVADPNSGLAFWSSIIPFTSPMVMMARIPFGIPGWQTALSIVLLYLTFFFMIWLAAKIYRVGIFMYGKKPSLGELIRWARYK